MKIINKLPMLFIAVLILGLSACDRHRDYYQGYIESRLAFISSPISGKLIELPVYRGQWVKPGELLFRLEQSPELDELESLRARVKQAQSNLEDLKKGKRPTEIDAIKAQIESIHAQIAFSKKALKRRKQLVKSYSVDEEEQDDALQSFSVNEANLKQLSADLATAELPARIDIIKAAQAELEAVIANAKQAQWALQQKTVGAFTKGQVFDTFFRVGEQVPAHRPIVSLLLPSEIYALFYVPERKLSTLKLGQTVNILCDSCKQPIQATISFISPRAEFTPPVIFSRESRAKLVYRVEARFSAKETTKLHPGQPIDVILDEK